jgi:cytolethal distending toxin subunit B
MTWNMEGSSAATENKWQTGVANFLKEVDVICLQECGGVPPSAIERDKYDNIKFEGKKPDSSSELYGYRVGYYWWGGTESRPRHLIYLKTDKSVKDSRVNIAVVSRFRPIKFISAEPSFIDSRPAIGMRILADHKQWDILSLHGLSGHGNDDKGLLININQVSTAPWFALGDYNRDWDKLTVPQGTGVSAPRAVTRRKSERILDYMVGNVKTEKIEVSAVEMSDHNAVRFEL